MSLFNNGNTSYARSWITLALVLLLSRDALCDLNVFHKTPGFQVVFAKENLSLPWMTSLPDDDILWCYWKYELGGAWDQFLGYHNVDKKRLNISPWNEGWIFLDESHPCSGGMMRHDVTSDYSGSYVMVVADHNGTEYESPSYSLKIVACPRPVQVLGADITVYTHVETIVAIYSCKYGANGDTDTELKCDHVTGTWSSNPPTCAEPNSSNPRLTTLEIVLVVMVVVLSVVLVILVFYVVKKRTFRRKLRKRKPAADETHRAEKQSTESITEAKALIKDTSPLNVEGSENSERTEMKSLAMTGEKDSNENCPETSSPPPNPSGFNAENQWLPRCSVQ